jgi:pimeloyl-ACP methyl ester carboxylesterase
VLGGLALVIALIAGALAVNTAIHVRRAAAAYPPTGAFAAVGGARIHYTTAGRGAPVVLIHGNPGSTRDFSGVAGELAGDHHVIAVDRPGHGHSDRTRDPTPSGQVAALHAVLQHLQVARPILVGHSWGGALALIYALEHPQGVAGLVLVGTRAAVQLRDPDLLYRLVTTPVIGAIAEWTVLLPIGRSIVDRRLMAVYAPEPVPDDELAAARALWLRPTQMDATVWDAANLQHALAAYGPRFASVRLPAILLVGDQDELLAESQALHQVMTQGELRILPGAGHMIVKTRPAAIADAVRALRQRGAGVGRH